MALASVSAPNSLLERFFENLHIASDPIPIPQSANAERVDAIFMSTTIACFSEQSKRKPARPILSGSCSDLFVFPTSEESGPGLIFKPGLEATAHATTAYALLQLCQLGDTVPEIVQGILPQAIASKDLDEDRREVVYVQRTDVIGRKLAVRKDAIFTLHREEEDFILLDNGGHESSLTRFTVEQPEQGKSSCSIHPRNTKLDKWLCEPFSSVELDGTEYLVPKSRIHTEPFKNSRVGKEKTVDGRSSMVYVPSSLCVAFQGEKALFQGQRFIVRNEDDLDFFLEMDESDLDDYVEDAFLLLSKTKKKITVAPLQACEEIIGDHIIRDQITYMLEYVSLDCNEFHLRAKDMPGYYQRKVENLFAESIRDIAQDTPERSELYSKIDMSSFIRAFVATIILRPPDCKVMNLKESNVLFKQVQEKVNIILIDLDEVLPKTHHLDEKGACAIRNGLMGFPQAWEPLKSDEMQMLISLLQGCCEASSAAEQLIKDKLGSAEAESYREMVEGVKSFLQNRPDSFSLSTLFFTLFKEYREHWELVSKNRSPQQIALLVGDENPSRIYI